MFVFYTKVDFFFISQPIILMLPAATFHLQLNDLDIFSSQPGRSRTIWMKI